MALCPESGLVRCSLENHGELTAESLISTMLVLFTFWAFFSVHCAMIYGWVEISVVRVELNWRVKSPLIQVANEMRENCSGLDPVQSAHPHCSSSSSQVVETEDF